MFQTLQNTAKIEVTLVPEGPLLVRAQAVGIDPGVADMEFQRTRRNGKSTVFLAGSGLKGVLRSHAERLLRSAGRFACDPTKTRSDRAGDDLACGVRKRDSPRPAGYATPFPHADNCGACFTFGSLKLAGRFRIADAYPADGALWEAANLTEVRTGVGINRRSQGAQDGVLYESEVVVGGGFRALLSAENFSLWQLGLVLAILQDLDSGLVRVGGCKARGMGGVKVTDWRVELGSLHERQGYLTGARAMVPAEEKYGLPEEQPVALPPASESSLRGLFRTVVLENGAVQALAEALIDGPLASYLAGRP